MGEAKGRYHEVSIVIGSLNTHTPEGRLAEKWQNYQATVKLVSPKNKRGFEIIVVGTGLAGASAAASLGELGYKVHAFTYHDSPRRAHSIAAQGGINAAKNYQNDGDSVWRLFIDTIKGGDYRSREANVHRLAEVSLNIIDQCVAQGVPFARDYGGLLDNRSFGGAQVSRTFYARGQTGQQLLLGAYSALMRQVGQGSVTLHNRKEMLELVVHEGRAVGIVVRDLLTGEVSSHSAHAVVLATGGYSNVYFLSTNAKMCNVTAAWRAHRQGALFANPCYTQIHPTCIPQSDEFQSKLTLMSESLRNDGRIWVPQKGSDTRPPSEIPDSERDYYLEVKYPAFGNLVPRDVASRNELPADHEVFETTETAVAQRTQRWLNINGTRSVDYFHRELGKLVWDNVGMSRSRPGLEKALSEIPALYEEYLSDVRVLGSAQTLNQSLEKAGRVADFFELAQLMARDALEREESCGGHFREEHQTPEGEARRDDDNFAHATAWEWTGDPQKSIAHFEPLDFTEVDLAVRSYK